MGSITEQSRPPRELKSNSAVCGAGSTVKSHSQHRNPFLWCMVLDKNHRSAPPGLLRVARCIGASPLDTDVPCISPPLPPDLPWLRRALRRRGEQDLCRCCFVVAIGDQSCDPSNWKVGAGQPRDPVYCCCVCAVCCCVHIIFFIRLRLERQRRDHFGGFLFERAVCARGGR